MVVKQEEQQTTPAKDASWTESVEHTPSRTSDTAKSKKTKAAKKPEIVCAIANYKPTGKEQLELKKGQMIQVRKRLESGKFYCSFSGCLLNLKIDSILNFQNLGWCFGEIQIKGKNKQSGYFPESYVKSMGKQSGASKDESGSAPKSPASNYSQPYEGCKLLFSNFVIPFYFFFPLFFNIRFPFLL